MKKLLVVGIIILLVGMSVPSTGINIEKSTSSYDGNTLYVGGSGPGNYTKIQDAIDDASDGNTIFVYDDSSPYNENIIIETSISLIGEDRKSTIIEGLDDIGSTIIIKSPYVTITGFTIHYCPGKQGDGIFIDNNPSSGNSHDNIIYGNIIEKTRYCGIVIYESSNNIIHNNNISTSKNILVGEAGIAMGGPSSESFNNTIYQNNIMNNHIGIRLLPGLEYGPYGNKVYHNNFFSNFIHVSDHGIDNQWDNGEEGNYWHDYKGEDSNGDGIGDEPYWISISNDIKDNYPLMEPFNNITSHSKIWYSEQKSELHIREIDKNLEIYGLETTDTIKDFEQTLNQLIYRVRWINPFLSFRLKNDIAELYDILLEMGISYEMTIAEALPIVERNKKSLRDNGINLFCSIDINCYGGGCRPLFRPYKVLFGAWEFGWDGHVNINSSMIGLQYCNYGYCKEGWSGKFIGMIGMMSINFITFITVPEYDIVGKFALYSKCDVPFVNSTSELQTPCHCEESIIDENLGLNTVHEGFGGYVK